MEKDALFAKVKELIIAEFNLDSDAISPETQLADQLQLDSLDMVDLVLSINDQQLVNEKIEPTIFKKARTMQDLVNALAPFWK